MQRSLFGPSPRASRVRVGPAGWNYKDWEGIVYPAGAGRRFDPLAYLAEYFDTIEINSSFYGPPRPNDAAAWARRVGNNPRFKFTAKVWQRLTHERDKLDAAGLVGAVEEVRRSMAPIAEAGLLGPLLLQFPWSFRNTPENQEHVAMLLRALADFRVAVEVRHADWDDELFFDLLREHGAAFCNVDQPVIGESLRPSARVTSAIGYFRLHGRNYKTWFVEHAGRDARYDYLYTPKEVGRMADLIRTIGDEAEETYAITNNHFRGQAVVNAIEIVAELEGQPPAVPPSLAAAYPRLVKESAAP
jgi:uncharacterized protein YecE (DUF72 family)